MLTIVQARASVHVYDARARQQFRVSRAGGLNAAAGGSCTRAVPGCDDRVALGA